MSDLITTFSTLQHSRPSVGALRALRLVGAADVPTDVVLALRQLELLASGDIPYVTPLVSSRAARIYRIELGWGVVCLKRQLAPEPAAAEAHAAERARAEAGWHKLACDVVPGAAPVVLGALPNGAVFAMEYLDADDFPSWQTRLAAGYVEPWVAAEVGHLIGRLHAASANSAAVRERFAAQAAFRALVLAPLLEQAARAVPGSEQRLVALEERLGAVRTALVHGTLAPDNVLLGPRGPVLIDADCAHSGDPVIDAATCLAALALRMVGHTQLRAELAASYDAFHRSYFAHVTWEMPEHAEARAAALIPVLLVAGLAGHAAAGNADGQRACDTARALLLEPPRQLDELCRRWLAALAGS
jgi:aminoglycoside phosphotransferase (APT) family kinase protein